MKMSGRKIQGPNEEILVLPRPDGDLVFKAKAVLDFTVFDGLVPQPKPPKVRRRGMSEPSDDPTDKNFQLEVQNWSSKRMDFMILESLRTGTPELEWETVDFNNPDTWKNYERELKEAGFTPSEINLLNATCISANSLSQSKLDEARERFLASRAEPTSNGSSPLAELRITQSGEHARGWESSRQE